MPRKTKKWVIAPSPGPHKKYELIPLAVVLRDVLNVASTGSDAKKIIKAGEILVDGRKRKDPGYTVGLFDVLYLPKTGEHYRGVPTQKGLQLVKISADDAGKKICKIENKTVLKKGKLQLNLHDGRNILADKNEYATGDSLLVQIPEMKILEHIKLEKGATGIVSKGVNSGKVGTVKEVKSAKAREAKKVSVDFDGEVEDVLVDRFFVLGKKEPAIKIA